MDDFLRRWWRHSWAPFALVPLGAIILWLVGYDFTESTPLILMVVLVCLLAVGISRRMGKTGNRLGKTGRDSWH